jgi:signal transduction histidine kinase
MAVSIGFAVTAVPAVRHHLADRVALGVMEEHVEEHVEPTQKQYVENAVEEVERMSGLVNELLQFSKAGLTAQAPAADRGNGHA